MKLFPKSRLILSLTVALSAAGTAHATTPAEPTFPANSCGSYAATITSQAPASLETGRDLPTGFDPATNTDTSSIQTALNNCASGTGQRALELVKGSGDAIYLKPITVPAGVSLTVAAGVTVFASNDARDYDVSSGTCGTYSAANDGCTALITFLGSSSGLYGYGIIDGRGWAPALNGNLTWTDSHGPHTCGVTGDSWWDRTINVGKSPCVGAAQNNPKLVFALGTNIVIYKITLRNAPFWNILWRSLVTASLSDPGITVWGLKVQSPWAVPNTDGIDIDGPNAFVTDSVFAVGDDEIAIEAPDWSDGGWRGDISGVTVQNSTGYGRNGMSIGSELYHNVNSTTINNVNLTSGYANVHQTGSTWYVNNTPLTAAGTGHSDITAVSQVMPATVTNIRGLNIKTNHYSTTPQASVTGTTFSNVCLWNIVQPITVQPYKSGLTSVTSVNAAYSNIFVMPSDVNQMVGYSGGTSYSPPAAAISFDALTSGNSTLSLANVTFADYTAGHSSVGYLLNNYSNISTSGSVFPSILNRLNLAHSTDPHGESASAGNEYVHTYTPQVTTGTIAATPLSSAPTGPTGFSCFAPGGSQTFSFLSIDANVSDSSGLHTNTSLGSTVTVNAGTVRIGAVVQPAMSQVAFYAASDYGETLYAFASPQPDNTLTFQLKDATGTTLLGSVTTAISAAGGEAYGSFTLTSGSDYTMIVYYPGDTSGQNVYPATWRRFKIHAN